MINYSMAQLKRTCMMCHLAESGMILKMKSRRVFPCFSSPCNLSSVPTSLVWHKNINSPYIHNARRYRHYPKITCSPWLLGCCRVIWDSPGWLLSFVYPHTSWMLMADSPLVYTSGWRRKTAHCSDRLLCNAKEVSVTKGTALGEAPDVHM